MGDSRYPISVRILGILYKDKSKRYMASVLWSDRTEVVVYRSLQDFRKCHRQLKKTLSVENPVGKRSRVLPRFAGRMKKVGLQKKTPACAVHRVKALQKYCTELLNCDPRVTQAPDLIRFFLPKEHELQPEFVQNSVMIFQSDDIPNGQTGGDSSSKHLNIGHVTQPFVTKTYRCVAPYETKDTKNRPFKVAVDESLDVLIKDQAGWWLVENEDKCLAWFPAPYLELCEDDEEEDNLNMAVTERSLYCAVRSYSSKTKDELSVTIGAVLEVLQRSDNGWWFARYNGKAGYIPSMYLKPYTSPTLSVQKKLYSSTLNLSTTHNMLQDISYPAQLQEHLIKLKTFHKSRSVDVLSEPPAKPSFQVQRTESESRKSSISSFSFSSSFSSEGEEESLRQAEIDQKDESGDSGLSDEQSSRPGSAEDRSLSKLAPIVPPRPKTQEILTRCTTYTRKAALATQTHRFPERIEIKAQSIGRD